MVILMVVIVHVQRPVVAKPLQAVSWSSICFQLVEQLHVHRPSLCAKDECHGGSNTGFDSALGLGSLRHYKEVYMLVAWLVVKGAGVLLDVMSKDILQSRHALPRDLRQLVFIGGDVVDNKSQSCGLASCCCLA